MTEGPVHSGEETFGGWFVLDVADHAEAIELARGFPAPETLEIRPILDSA
ncbi:YciI family protein [Streptomyces sp. NRRL B-24720]|nr:YciI family protein [Streptomyces sp. NRRL B-24720]